MSSVFLAGFSGYDSAEHRSAQQACRCRPRCAVDAEARARVVEAAAVARRKRDQAALGHFQARLAGPCCLPPTDPP